MYKVFDNDKLLILSQEPIGSQNIKYDKQTPSELISWWKNMGEQQANIYAEDLGNLWQTFQSYYKVIEAAGGLVTFNDEFITFIRLEKWDLPKGKVESGENFHDAALREVAEECGVVDLILENKITITYHTYLEGGTPILKPTHWYKMKLEEKQKLTKQVDEGITHIQWHPVKQIQEVLQNTYPNIKLVLEEGLQK